MRCSGAPVLVGEYKGGLAWQVNEKKGRFSVRGYKSLLISYPQERNGLVLLTNTAKAPWFEIAGKLTQTLRDTGIWQ
ncbi:hypothetical protein PVT68_14145 [Microbulbifer bruguierae]|uniref:Beta-lactamase n=1 Tax=Microbulbifer bruguierae TaxID=3029061 RepID=A0ABY8NAI1_9GAMM|nr:hypothetical protein [Microbulbifer bruguierae]WGL15906.1 hypothetical protein PVT68_14145 [Microbulbifer bruguierae]